MVTSKLVIFIAFFYISIYTNMAKLRQGGVRSDHQRNLYALPADTYNESGQIRYHNDIRGKHLDEYGEVTNYYDPDSTIQYFNNRVTDTNWHESGNTWRTADAGITTKTQVGVDNNGVPIYHMGNGKRTHGSRMYSKFAQGAFSTKYKKDHTMVVPFSADETGLSMSVDIRHDKPHHKNVHDRMTEHNQRTADYQSKRKKPDPLKLYSDDQRNPLMSRFTPSHVAGDRGDQDRAEQLAQTGGGHNPVAKYHKLTSRDNEIMKRLQINPQTGQIMNAKPVHMPANVAYTAQAGVGGQLGPISKNESHIETKRANLGLSNAAKPGISSRDHAPGGPFAMYYSDAKRINPRLLQLMAAKSQEYNATVEESDIKRHSSPNAAPSAAFLKFWEELPRAARENDIKKLEELLDTYNNFARVESAAAQAASKTSGRWDNEVKKTQERSLQAALEQLEREQPQLWKTLENSESPKVRARILEMRKGKSDKSFESQRLSRSIELSMKRLDERKARTNVNATERDANGLNRVSEFESKLLQDKIITDRFGAMAHTREWHTGDTTMASKQTNTKERTPYGEVLESALGQIFENVHITNISSVEEPLTKPVQSTSRTGGYRNPIATGRVPITEE